MSAISGVGSAANARQTTNAFGALGSEEFMKIIFTELQTQDPLEPSDTSSLLQQLSTIRSIESDLNLTAKLDSFVQQNEVISATALVGKFIAAKGQFGSEEAGFVDSVLLTINGPILNLSNGSQVAFDRVTEIIDPALIAKLPGAPAAPADEADSDDQPPGDEDPPVKPEEEGKNDGGAGDPPGGQ